MMIMRNAYCDDTDLKCESEPNTEIDKVRKNIRRLFSDIDFSET